MTRYVAEWCSKVAVNRETGDVETELCEYDTAVLPALADAAKHACECNCYGSEGFVNVQTWGRDRCTGQRAWITVERWLCQDGETVERVETSWGAA